MMKRLLSRLFRRRRTATDEASRCPKADVDPYYSDINSDQLHLYQEFLSRILNEVDIANYTRWSQSKPYDTEKAERQDAWMLKVLEDAQGSGLNAGKLQNMVHQFFFADVLERELVRDRFVERVLHRRPTDFFPDASRLRQIMQVLQ